MLMILRSIKLLIAIAPKAPTWRVSCRCLTTDSLSRGYPGQLVGLWRVLELDSECKDSQFILVWALDRDRVIALRLVGVSLCVGLIVLCHVLLQGCPQPLFISVDIAVVRNRP
jgi:hypothetical protein